MFAIDIYDGYLTIVTYPRDDFRSTRKCEHLEDGGLLRKVLKVRLYSKYLLRGATSGGYFGGFGGVLQGGNS